MSKELDQYIRRLVREVPGVLDDILENKNIVVKIWIPKVSFVYLQGK